MVDFAWVGSFAAARNESLRHATGRWASRTDADDRLDDENRRRQRELFRTPDDGLAANVMKCACLPAGQGDDLTAVDHVRLFPSHPAVRRTYHVHEQILPAVRRVGGSVRGTDLVIHHTRHQDAGLRCRKRERDLRLLQLEDAEHPDEAFVLFNLGASATRPSARRTHRSRNGPCPGTPTKPMRSGRSIGPQLRGARKCSISWSEYLPTAITPPSGACDPRRRRTDLRRVPLRVRADGAR